MDKFARAKIALLGGADLVLELPFPFSAASAAYFAKAGVSILSAVGANSLVFGSESGDASRLWELAVYSLSEDFAKQKQRADAKEGSALAYFKALLGEDARLMPNDILAVEYLRTIKKDGHWMQALAIPRIGDGFSEKSLGASEYASATAIRRALSEKEPEGLEAYMPELAFSELKQALERGETPATLANAERAILSHFRLTAPQALSEIAGLGNGLEYRLCECAGESRNLSELLATKRYTDAAIRRAMLAAMTGVTYADLDRGAAYTAVLGANERGRALLASLRKKNLPILTKPSDIEALCERLPEKATAIRRQAQLSARADALYTLCLPQTAETGKYLRSGAIML